MIELITHPELEVLALELARRLRSDPLRNPFEAEIILVPHSGYKPWLKQFLARKLGLSANLELIFVRQFVWQLARTQVDKGPRHQSQQDADDLAWRLLDLWPELVEDPEFSEIKDYLHAQPGLTQRWQLAQQLAQLLDLYSIYRPDWIQAWEAGGEAPHWQARLWQKLYPEVHSEPEQRQAHRVNLRQRLLAALQEADNPRLEQLPRRITVFGLQALPPFYMDVLQALAQHSQVSFYLAAPPLPLCLADAAAQPLSLANNGQQLREFLTGLQAPQHVAAEALPWNAPVRPSLLQQLQAEILGVGGQAAEPGLADFSPADSSLQIHACHSPLRELEVLQDQLWLAFGQWPELQPQDVAVLIPDLATYAPLIEAVFGQADSTQQRLPYQIADRALLQENPLFQAFQLLLSLAHSRLTLSEVLALLEQAPVALAWELSAEDLNTLRHWLEAVQIRWGRDAAHREALDLPAFETNSWCSGLERLLLGYALPDQGQEPFQGILPYSHVEGQQAALLGKVLAFFSCLTQTQARLEGQHLLSQWPEILWQAAQDFLQVSAEQSEALQTLQAQIEALHAQQALYPAAVSLQVIRPWLEARLKAPSGRGLFQGGITFASPDSLRGLPFKLICVLGLNARSWPRQDLFQDLDLRHGIGVQPRRPGDESQRLSDRGLWLECLLAARQGLYLSYLGRRIRDNHALPPSVLVAELLDSLQQLTQGRFQVCVHPLHPFDPSYFEAQAPRSHREADAELARLQLSAERWPRRPFALEPLPPLDALESDDAHESHASDASAAGETHLLWSEFLRFFRNPAASFLQRRLGLRYAANPGQIADSERFVLDSLDSYTVAQNWLSWRLNPSQQQQTQTQNQVFFARQQAAGQLPVGRAATRWQEELEAQWGWMIQPLRLWLGQPEEPESFALSCGRWQLSGLLSSRYAQAMLSLRPARLKASDYLETWLQSLLCWVLQKPQTVYRIGLSADQKKEPLMLSFAPPADPQAELLKLLELYARGLEQVLCFAPQSSWDYWQNMQKPSSKLKTPEAIQTAALAAAQKRWEDDSGDFSFPENRDPALARCLPEQWWHSPDFASCASQLYASLWSQRQELTLAQFLQEAGAA